MPEQPNGGGQGPGSVVDSELGTSLASVWARYFGSRPARATAELRNNVVRWVLPRGAKAFETGMSDGGRGAKDRLPGRTVEGYERETSAAVRRTTGRAVKARMSKRDADTGAATEIFILEETPHRN